MNKNNISQLEIQDWLVSQIAELAQISKEEINVSEPIENYGLDSMQAVVISGELGKWLNRELPPTLVWEFSTIELISLRLADNEIEEG